MRSNVKHTVFSEKYTFVDKVMIALIVLYSFYYLEPYFVWETFAGGVFRELFGIVPYRTLFGLGAVIICLAFYSRKVTKYKAGLCGLTLLIAIFTLCLAGGTENNSMLSLAWLPYFVVIAYILSPDKIQKQSYKVFVNIFTISLIFPIIWYILTHVGINVPYVVVEPKEEIKVTRGWYYRVYPFAVQLRSKWLDSSISDLRLCGVFDEGGRVGTIAGLVLTNEKFKLKGNWKNIVIFIGGILSFSLAFYLFAVIYYMISCFEKKKYKNAVIIFGVIISYFVFMNIEFSDPNILSFQKRFEITSEGLAGYNRTNDSFDELMNEFYSSSTYDVFFGRGVDAISHMQSARNIDGSSYKSMIYNFGFLGFGLSIVWIFLYAALYSKKKSANRIHIIGILAAYIANMYQRPSVFYMGYMLIFFGGIIIASQEKEAVRAAATGKKRRRLFRVRHSSAFGNIQW